jgi:protein SCO1/2
MHEPSRRNLLGFAALAPFAGSLMATHAAAEVAAPRSPRERIRQLYFPNIVLRTQDDKEVRFYDDLVKDKVVTINFFYAKCDEICPVVMANLARVQKLLGERMGRDVFMNSITLKAVDDSPGVLKHHAEMYGARPGWSFLTGKAEDIELLRRSLGFTNPDPRVDKDVTQHIGNVRYGNEPLMLWAACPGMARPEWIAESISWVIRPESQTAPSKG